MANEITIIGTRGREIEALFLFPIAVASRIKSDSTGLVDVVPTPSASLPDGVAVRLAQVELDALDAGAGMFEVTRCTAEPGLTALQIAARLRAMYAEREALLPSEYAATFQFSPRIGTRLNK